MSLQIWFEISVMPVEKKKLLGLSSYFLIMIAFFDLGISMISQVTKAYKMVPYNLNKFILNGMNSRFW